jgi:hypothetical protein
MASPSDTLVSPWIPLVIRPVEQQSLAVFFPASATNMFNFKIRVIRGGKTLPLSVGRFWPQQR